MELEAVRPLPPLPVSPKSIADVESDQVSVVSSLESLPPPPLPFPPLDQLLQNQPDEDANSDAETVQYDYDDMTDVDVVGIQRACADALTFLLRGVENDQLTVENQYLATAVGDLLEAAYELETFHPSCSISSPHTPPEDGSARSPFFSLLQVLMSVQSASAKRTPNPLLLPDTPSSTCDMHHPQVSAAREELAWARVESCSQTVIQLVRERDQPTASLAAQALPPKYRRSERDSSEGSEKSLPPYKANPNDAEIVESSPQSPMEKPITGVGDRKARMEEEEALEEAERRARAPRKPNKMGSILNDLDTVTDAIERLQCISKMEDQRVALRPSSSRRASTFSPISPPVSPQRSTSLSKLNYIVEKSVTERLNNQRMDLNELNERRMSRRLFASNMDDAVRTLDDQRPLNAGGNSKSAGVNAVVRQNTGSPIARPPPANGSPDQESELRSPSSEQQPKVSLDSLKHDTVADPQVLSVKKQSNRRIYLYDDGPLTPQSGSGVRRSSDESAQDVLFKPRSLSPSSMEFMFKELPMPPAHDPLTRSRRTSKETLGARRSLSSNRSLSSSPGSDFDNESTVRARRARSPPRAPPTGSRSSSMARMPLREAETRSIASVPMSPTFSDISVASGRISAAHTPLRTTFDDHYLNRLSSDSKVSAWSKTSSKDSGRSQSSLRGLRLPKSPSVKKHKPPSLWSGPRSPSSRSLPQRAEREEDLFDLLSSAASSTRMSNQEVELPRVRRRTDLTPKADWRGLGQGDDTPPVTPRIVESVADGEWVIRLQDQENSFTPRSPYSAHTPHTGSSLRLPLGEGQRSSRRNSFSSIMSNSPRVPPSPSGTGGFKKFAASIKSSTLNRKSTKPRPPPLRTSGALDGSSVTYVTEYQENLRSIQILISGVDITFLNTADLQLEVTTPKQALLTSKSDPTLRVSIALPSPAPLNTVAHLQPVDDYLEAKLPAMPVPNEGSGSLLHTHIAHALSAPNLRSLAPRSLCCTSCDRVVAHLPLDVEFKDLPSEYWAEMIEVWMCHADPAFTSQLAKHTSDGFWPSPDTVLVGGSYLLVSGSHICDSHLVLEKSNEPDQWRIITCPCGEVLGKLRPEDGRPGAGTVRFSKWAIALLRGKGAGEISPVRYPVSTFVVSDMLELSQAHASHRFVICDERSGDRRLAIWVFNPSIQVAYRRANDGATTAPLVSPLKGTFARHLYNNGGRNSNAIDLMPFMRTLRAAKIMFKVLDPYSPSAEYENLPGFGPRGQVEHLRYSRDVCVTLIETLRASAALYPAARRNMGSFDVGFLERV